MSDQTARDTAANVSVHHAWLQTESQRLIAWARQSRTPSAFGYLDAVGRVSDDEASLLITARMTYVFALMALLGDEAARADAEHGVAALAVGSNDAVFWDRTNGGWNSRVGADGQAFEPTPKSAYDHAFVLLAAATCALADIPGAVDLLDSASSVLLDRFWREEEGALVDAFSADWSETENYRGANANMHFVETCLVAYDATGDERWLHRATRIADRLINVNARDNEWRLLEHYDGDWNPLPDYNLSNPADQFRPFGYLVGHSLEWSRLLLHLGEALRDVKRPLAWLSEAAAALWGAAFRYGWETDGHPGFLYSLDWKDAPVVDRRLHWVIAEGVGAAWALYEETHDPSYRDWHDRLVSHIQERFVDEEHGSWHHERSPEGQPSAEVWSGKPDVFHALNAVLISLVPFASSLPAGAHLLACSRFGSVAQRPPMFQGQES